MSALEAMEKAKSLRQIARAVLVVGLAAVSVFAWLSSDGKIGDGWALVAFLVLVLGD